MNVITDVTQTSVFCYREADTLHARRHVPDTCLSDEMLSVCVTSVCNTGRLLLVGCLGLAGGLHPLPARAHAAAPSLPAQRDNGTQTQVLDRRLCQAAETGNLVRVKRLLTHGASVNAAQKNGWTALMLAARDSHVSVVKFLLNRGADPRRRSVLYNDVDALMLAAEAGNVPICRMLLAHGADVNETDVSGNTPLMLALGNGNLTPEQEYRIVKALIKAGADTSKRNHFKQTALDYAQRSRFEPPLTKVTKLLLAAGGKY